MLYCMTVGQIFAVLSVGMVIGGLLTLAIIMWCFWDRKE